LKVLGIRFCSVSNQARELAQFLTDLGLPHREPGPGLQAAAADTHVVEGSVFPAGTGWIEVWPEGPELPSGVLLQIVVDDAVEFASHAKRNGLDPQGPVDAHGERIYFLQAPSGLPITFQSALPKRGNETRDE
jgi:hypothetical protein